MKRFTINTVRTRSLLALTVASLIWGSGWVFSPLLAPAAAPLAASALVLGIAACLLAPACLLFRGSPPGVSWRVSAALGISMLAAPTVLVHVADKHGVAGWVPLLYALLPLLAAAQAFSVTMVVAAGATLVLLGGSVPFAFQKLPWTALVLAAVWSQAFALRYAARQCRGADAAALLASLAFQCAFACVCLVAASLLFDPAPRLLPPSQWTSEALLGLFWTAVIGTALAYALLYRLLAHSTLAPHQVAVTQWLQLLTGLAEAGIFAHVWPSVQSLAAAAVLAGCALLVLLQPPHSNPGIPLGVNAGDTGSS